MNQFFEGIFFLKEKLKLEFSCKITSRSFTESAFAIVEESTPETLSQSISLPVRYFGIFLFFPTVNAIGIEKSFSLEIILPKSKLV